VSPSSTPGPVAWLRAARPDAFPIVFLLFGAGAAAGALDVRAFDLTRALVGYVCLALIQFASVLTNEHFDYAGDILNRNAGRFSGGTRVIVEGALSHDSVLRGVAASIALLGAASGLLLAISPHDIRIPVLVLLAAGVVLGLGHTAPPLQLSHRGYGEINLAFTHGAYPVLAGWVVMGARAADPLPWLVGVPAFWALFSARTLAGIPDIAADRAVRRRTYAVIFGPRSAGVLAVCAAAAAGIAGVLLWRDRVVSGWPGMAYLAAAAHALVLAAAVIAFVRSGDHDRRIDGILANAHAFVLWFGLIPFVYFVRLALG
jgi:1,4-dihydroxy-2-naphthoate octaprenyltransferase